MEAGASIKGVAFGLESLLRKNDVVGVCICKGGPAVVDVSGELFVNGQGTAKEKDERKRNPAQHVYVQWCVCSAREGKRGVDRLGECMEA